MGDFHPLGSYKDQRGRVFVSFCPLQHVSFSQQFSRNVQRLFLSIKIKIDKIAMLYFFIVAVGIRATERRSFEHIQIFVGAPRTCLEVCTIAV